MRYKISVKALEDVEGIWQYTVDNWSMGQADRYIDLIFDEIEKIPANPTKGKDIRHLKANYRYCRSM